jgi:alanine dehydrogenase
LEPATLILTRTDVAALMRPADYRLAAERAFVASLDGSGVSPSPMHIETAGRGGFHIKGAGFPAGALTAAPRSYVAVKINGNFPANADLALPTIQGVIVLCDGDNGSPLAVIDSMEVTLRRTAAATAAAALRLARPDSAVVTVCGCGAQAGAQLEALREVLPLKRAHLWDSSRQRAEALCAGLDLPATVVDDLAAAALQSDVIVTCTTTREPFLGPAQVRRGTFVAAVGADSPQKSEIAPALMASATVVVDVLEQCLAMGDLRHAVAAGARAAGDVHAELAQGLAGQRPGRTSQDEVTLFDSTGTAILDVASAALIYERAIADGLGARVAFGT